jgi:hypothetical protein
MAFNAPTPREEQLFLKSLERTDQEYRAVLIEAGNQHLNLPNKDFDTGRQTRAGEYVLSDKTYARLLDELAKRHFARLTPDLRTDILAFYSDLNAPIATKHDRRQWERTMAELNQLKATPAAPEPVIPAVGGHS